MAPARGLPAAAPGQPSSLYPPPVVYAAPRTSTTASICGSTSAAATACWRQRYGNAVGAGVSLGAALGGVVAPGPDRLRHVLRFSASDPRMFPGPDGYSSGTLDGVTLTMVGLGGGVAYYLPNNVYVAGALATMRWRCRNRQQRQPSGVAFGLGLQGLLGKEWWVSHNWALGIAGQLTGATMTDKVEARAGTGSRSRCCSPPRTTEKTVGGIPGPVRDDPPHEPLRRPLRRAPGSLVIGAAGVMAPGHRPRARDAARRRPAPPAPPPAAGEMPPAYAPPPGYQPPPQGPPPGYGYPPPRYGSPPLGYPPPGYGYSTAACRLRAAAEHSRRLLPADAPGRRLPAARQRRHVILGARAVRSGSRSAARSRPT